MTSARIQAAVDKLLALAKRKARAAPGKPGNTAPAPSIVVTGSGNIVAGGNVTITERRQPPDDEPTP